MSPSKTFSMDFTSFSNIIDGQLRGGKTVHNGIDPATKEKLWNVPCATQEDVEDAVVAAQNAFPAWAKTPFEERTALIMKFAEAYSTFEESFTELMTKETGKPVPLTYSLDLSLADF